MDALISIENFHSLSDFENFEINIKGLYALRVKNIELLPTLFKNELVSKESTLIYIGKAEKSTIHKRLLQECFGEGHGTFFRSIGALLSFKPQKGSLIGKSNKNNYCFSKENKTKIIKWMNDNLDFNFVEIKIGINNIERKLIKIHCPILNTTHNPSKSKTLAILRKECREYGLSEL